MRFSIDAIVFDKELYPRFEADNNTVNQYRSSLDQLPPIVITKDMILIDGYHRLLAHRLEGRTEIEAEIMDIPREQVLIESVRRNSKHGLQLSLKEKKRLVRQLYRKGTMTRQEDLAQLFSVSQPTISNWVSDYLYNERKARREDAWELFHEGGTQAEIAEELGVSQQTVSRDLKLLTRKMISYIPSKPPRPEKFGTTEEKIMVSFMRGVPFKDIADEVGWDKEDVENTVKRIEDKFRCYPHLSGGPSTKDNFEYYLANPPRPKHQRPDLEKRFYIENASPLGISKEKLFSRIKSERYKVYDFYKPNNAIWKLLEESTFEELSFNFNIQYSRDYATLIYCLMDWYDISEEEIMSFIIEQTKEEAEYEYGMALWSLNRGRDEMFKEQDKYNHFDRSIESAKKNYQKHQNLCERLGMEPKTIDYPTYRDPRYVEVPELETFKLVLCKGKWDISWSLGVDAFPKSKIVEAMKKDLARLEASDIFQVDQPSEILQAKAEATQKERAL